MVEFEHAGFASGATEVLRDVSLTVEAGAFCLVYGEAGAGKTTLIRLCRGELAATEGEVRVLGRPVPVGDRHALARLRRRIGLVERRNSFLDHLSLGENVAAPLLAEGDAASRREDISALLAWVGLAERAGLRPSALSREERRRAALARAVITSPELVAADEPTGGLPEEAGFALVDFFLDLHAMGTTILLATEDCHLVEHLLRAGTVQVAHLASGRIEALA